MVAFPVLLLYVIYFRRKMKTRAGGWNRNLFGSDRTGDPTISITLDESIYVINLQHPHSLSMSICGQTLRVFRVAAVVYSFPKPQLIRWYDS